MRATPKTRLVQKVLRQLIETYGFDRKDIRTRYRLTTAGRRQTVDIVIFRRGREALDERAERVIVCQPQKPREKLRSGSAARNHSKRPVKPPSTAVSPNALKKPGHGSRVCFAATGALNI